MKFNFNSDFNSDKGVLLFVCIRNKPMHNYASHCADSFRTGIIGEGAELSNWKKNIPVNTNYIV